MDAAQHEAVRSLGIAWFAMAPVAEEPWLREEYGEPYERYRREVPRFLRIGRA